MEYWLSKQQADEAVSLFKEKQKKIIEEQQLQAKLIKAGKTFNELMEEWKTNKNKKELLDKFFKIEQTQKIKELEKIAKTRSTRKKRKKKPHKQIQAKPLEVGDCVRMANFPQKGKILSITKDSAIVELGNLQYNVKIDKLKAVQSSTIMVNPNE
jgi:sRNA-binding protein